MVRWDSIVEEKLRTVLQIVVEDYLKIAITCWTRWRVEVVNVMERICSVADFPGLGLCN